MSRLINHHFDVAVLILYKLITLQNGSFSLSLKKIVSYGEKIDEIQTNFVKD